MRNNNANTRMLRKLLLLAIPCFPETVWSMQEPNKFLAVFDQVQKLDLKKFNTNEKDIMLLQTLFTYTQDDVHKSAIMCLYGLHCLKKEMKRVAEFLSTNDSDLKTQFLAEYKGNPHTAEQIVKLFENDNSSKQMRVACSLASDWFDDISKVEDFSTFKFLDYLKYYPMLAVVAQVFTPDLHVLLSLMSVKNLFGIKEFFLDEGTLSLLLNSFDILFDLCSFRQVLFSLFYDIDTGHLLCSPNANSLGTHLSKSSLDVVNENMFICKTSDYGLFKQTLIYLNTIDFPNKKEVEGTLAKHIDPFFFVGIDTDWMKMYGVAVKQLEDDRKSIFSCACSSALNALQKIDQQSQDDTNQLISNMCADQEAFPAFSSIDKIACLLRDKFEQHPLIQHSFDQSQLNELTTLIQKPAQCNSLTTSFPRYDVCLTPSSSYEFFFPFFYRFLGLDDLEMFELYKVNCVDLQIFPLLEECVSYNFKFDKDALIEKSKTFANYMRKLCKTVTQQKVGAIQARQLCVDTRNAFKALQNEYKTQFYLRDASNASCIEGIDDWFENNISSVICGEAHYPCGNFSYLSANRQAAEIYKYRKEIVNDINQIFDWMKGWDENKDFDIEGMKNEKTYRMECFVNAFEQKNDLRFAGFVFPLFLFAPELWPDEYNERRIINRYFKAKMEQRLDLELLNDLNKFCKQYPKYEQDINNIKNAFEGFFTQINELDNTAGCHLCEFNHCLDNISPWRNSARARAYIQFKRDAPEWRVFQALRAFEREQSLQVDDASLSVNSPENPLSLSSVSSLTFSPESTSSISSSVPLSFSEESLFRLTRPLNLTTQNVQAVWKYCCPVISPGSFAGSKCTADFDVAANQYGFEVLDILSKTRRVVKDLDSQGKLTGTEVAAAIGGSAKLTDAEGQALADALCGNLYGCSDALSFFNTLAVVVCGSRANINSLKEFALSNTLGFCQIETFLDSFTKDNFGGSTFEAILTKLANQTTVCQKADGSNQQLGKTGSEHDVSDDGAAWVTGAVGSAKTFGTTLADAFTTKLKVTAGFEAKLRATLPNLFAGMKVNLAGSEGVAIVPNMTGTYYTGGEFRVNKEKLTAINQVGYKGYYSDGGSSSVTNAKTRDNDDRLIEILFYDLIQDRVKQEGLGDSSFIAKMDDLVVDDGGWEMLTNSTASGNVDGCCINYSSSGKVVAPKAESPFISLAKPLGWDVNAFNRSTPPNIGELGIQEYGKNNTKAPTGLDKLVNHIAAKNPVHLVSTVKALTGNPKTLRLVLGERAVLDAFNKKLGYLKGTIEAAHKGGTISSGSLTKYKFT
ncbi:hypothetical protein FACS1894113_2630 [Alphaproteobacteria bacterium]|nr:hypothetical protein FACS1894113_2630 [Alphaproteobacteria bacterium]